MIEAIPDANQTFREITFDVVSKRVENDIQPAGVLRGLSRAGSCMRATTRTAGSRAGRTSWSPTPKPETTEHLSGRSAVAWCSIEAKRAVDLVLSDGIRL